MSMSITIVHSILSNSAEQFYSAHYKIPIGITLFMVVTMILRV